MEGAAGGGHHDPRGRAEGGAGPQLPIRRPRLPVPDRRRGGGHLQQLSRAQEDKLKLSFPGLLVTLCQLPQTCIKERFSFSINQIHKSLSVWLLNVFSQSCASAHSFSVRLLLCVVRE